MMLNTTVQPEKKPAFARPSGTTTSATAPAAKRNTITDSSTASNRCLCTSLESSRLLHYSTTTTSNQQPATSNQFNIKNKKHTQVVANITQSTSVTTQILFNILKYYIFYFRFAFGCVYPNRLLSSNSAQLSVLIP